MNKEYIVNGDKAFVTDENGKMTLRYNTSTLEQELVLENSIEVLENKIKEENANIVAANEKINNFSNISVSEMSIGVLLIQLIPMLSVFATDVNEKIVMYALSSFSFNALVLAKYTSCFIGSGSGRRKINIAKDRISVLSQQIEIQKTKLKELERTKEVFTTSKEQEISKPIIVEDRLMIEELNQNLEISYQKTNGKRRVLRKTNNQ